MNRVALLLALLVACALGGRPFQWSYNGMPRTGAMGKVHGGWPACDPNVTQYSGYFTVNATENKNYFYWAFESRRDPANDPVILWMTGGPGCSGSLATLAENGPCHIHEKTGEMYHNPYAWNEVATIVYIDQPAGVGFSYSDLDGYDVDEKEVAHDMYYFLQAFYDGMPQFKKNPFFISGESYGGHYAPATAHRVWRGNKDHDGPHYIPLQGLSVGNGMTNPPIQFQHYASLAYTWCEAVLGHPCVNKSTYDTMLAAIPKCRRLALECNYDKTNKSCVDALNYCQDTQMGPYFATGLNVYDIRKPCIGELCYNYSAIVAALNRPEVQKQLGVKPQTWQICSFKVNKMFEADWMREFEQKVPDLLENNIRVMIYAGEMDFICNWMGNKAWTMALDWSKKALFQRAPDRPWYVDQVEAGMARSVYSESSPIQFSFVLVHGAGHMVPQDQPKRALTMITKLLENKSFYP